ncbi:protein FLX-like 3 [Hordeum vulgare]|nr:protein FLX-like 3 [Hordeum vulgare]
MLNPVEKKGRVCISRLIADRHALAEEGWSYQEINEQVRHLNMIIEEINDKNGAYINKLIGKRRKLQAELRSNEPLTAEVVHLCAEIEKLLAVRKELSTKAASLMHKLSMDKSGR